MALHVFLLNQAFGMFGQNNLYTGPKQHCIPTVFRTNNREADILTTTLNIKDKSVYLLMVFSHPNGGLDNPGLITGEKSQPYLNASCPLSAPEAWILHSIPSKPAALHVGGKKEILGRSCCWVSFRPAICACVRGNACAEWPSGFTWPQVTSVCSLCTFDESISWTGNICLINVWHIQGK